MFVIYLVDHAAYSIESHTRIRMTSIHRMRSTTPLRFGHYSRTLRKGGCAQDTAQARDLDPKRSLSNRVRRAQMRHSTQNNLKSPGLSI